MKNLYLVGAGGLGREVMNIIQDIHLVQGVRWNIKGFLDDTEDPLHGRECDFPVVGTIRDYIPTVNDVVVVCIGNPTSRRKLVDQLRKRGVIFDSIMANSVYMGRHNYIGEGTIAYGGFGMTVNVTIGDFVVLDNCVLGHDVRIGNFCTISGGCRLLGGVSLGDGVFLGASVNVAPGVHIGNNAYVGIGSVVVRNVKAGEKVFGNPAREIGL